METRETPTVSPWQHRLLGLLRIVTGFLFIAHGTQKILGFPPSDRAPGAMDALALTAGYMELIGGALIIVGLLTRPVAFLLSGLMAVAYFKAHAPQGFWPIVNRGELAVLYCFLFLYFVAAGAGAFSLDSLFRRDRKPAESNHPMHGRKDHPVPT